MAVAPQCFAGSYAYIPNSNLDTVSVIRTSDNVTIENIPVGKEPYGVAVSPDGNYVYVTNRGDNTVSVVNTSDNEVTETVTVGGKPAGIAASPDGQYIYVANYSDDTLSVISVDGDENNVVTATLATGDGPFGVAVEPDGEYVYVTNRNANTVSVISADKNTATVTVGQEPVGITSDPDGDYVYVANSADNTLSVISIQGSNQDEDDEDEDDDDNRVVATVSVGISPWGVAVNQDGSYVYVSNNGDNTVSVIRTSDRTLTATVTVGSEPMGISGPENGTIIYVLNYGDDTISVIYTGNGNVVGTLDAVSGAGVTGTGAFVGGRPPTAPTDLVAETDSDDAIILTWTDNAYDELGFKIERREVYDDDNDEFVQIATVGSNVTSYTSGSLSSVTTYEYRIRAYNEAADSEYSNTASDQTEEADASTSCFINSESVHASALFFYIMFLLCLFNTSNPE